MIPGHKIDTFGAGFRYLGLSDQFKSLTANLIQLRGEYGTEFFYSFAITPWNRYTVDLEVALLSTTDFDTAIIPGIRLEPNL
jgi:porin